MCRPPAAIASDIQENLPAPGSDQEEDPSDSDPGSDSDSFMADNELKPVASPKMSCLLQHAKCEYVAWTGGNPKRNWTGLNDSAPKVRVHNGQLRSMLSQKDDAYCEKGLEEKITKLVDLMVVRSKLVAHFAHYGLDTVAYLRDPSKDNKIKFVIDNYPCYTVESAREHGVAQSKLYDSYNLVNNRTACTASLSSLDTTLYKTVHSALIPDNTFPVACWMLLFEELQLASIQHFTDIKLKIAAYSKPSQESGQNIGTNPRPQKTPTRLDQGTDS
jgi:hypothetical protein